MDYRKEIAKAGLEIRAIKLNPNKPFQWSSGLHMPIYNDNRMFLGFSEYRNLITKGFKQLIEDEQIPYQIIAGISTGGIPYATCLANELKVPMIYIREKPKGYGLKNRIEGIDAESDLKGKKVIIIEDLISMGESSAKTVQAVRDANGDTEYCLSIFNYEFQKAEEIFQGKRACDKEGKKFLTPPCNVKSLLTYDVLLEVAKEQGYLTAKQIKILEEWRADPLGWGEKHGFPKIEK